MSAPFFGANFKIFKASLTGLPRTIPATKFAFLAEILIPRNIAFIGNYCKKI
jgi:hypothetical protein